MFSRRRWLYEDLPAEKAPLSFDFAPPALFEASIDRCLLQQQSIATIASISTIPDPTPAIRGVERDAEFDEVRLSCSRKLIGVPVRLNGAADVKPDKLLFAALPGAESGGACDGIAGVMCIAAPCRMSDAVANTLPDAACCTVGVFTPADCMLFVVWCPALGVVPGIPREKR